MRHAEVCYTVGNQNENTLVCWTRGDVVVRRLTVDCAAKVHIHAGLVNCLCSEKLSYDASQIAPTLQIWIFIVALVGIGDGRLILN